MRTALVSLVLVSTLAACSGSGSSSDTVDQPDLGPDNGVVDPTQDDKESTAAKEACNSGDEVKGRELRIVTTVAPITNLVASMVGDSGAIVEGVVPEGTNSHTFEPPPSAAQTLERADIIFMNGLGLEEPTKAMAEANADGAVICELGTAALSRSSWIFDFSFPESAGLPNPHVWTNPPMVLPFLDFIRGALANADPANVDLYDANYVKISNQVMALDTAMKTAAETVPAGNRKLLTYHDAYAYFARHYDWEVIGAIQPSSFEEPSPQDVASLINQVTSTGVPAIFGSEVFPSTVLEQIGKETGVRYVDVLRDDDLPGKPGDPEHSWFGLMRFDFVTMVEALGGDASALKALTVDTSIVDKGDYPQ